MEGLLADFSFGVKDSYWEQRQFKNLIFKYRMASTICVTNLDTMLEEIVRSAVVEFYNFLSRFTLKIQEPYTPFLVRRKFNSC